MELLDSSLYTLGFDIEIHFLRASRVGFDRRYRFAPCLWCKEPGGYFLAFQDSDREDRTFFDIRWRKLLGGGETKETGKRIRIKTGVFYKVDKCLCREVGVGAYRIEPTAFSAMAALLHHFPFLVDGLLNFDMDAVDMESA